MPKFLLALTFGLFLCHVNYAQEPVQPKGMETGFYELVLKESNDSPEQKLVVFLRKKGDSLELFDLAKKQKYKTRIVEQNTISFSGERTTIRAATFQLESPDKGLPSQLTFVSLRGNDLLVALAKGDRQSALSVVRLASVWACGNHDNPTHTAQSFAEMKEKTDRLGCSLWHKLTGSDMK